MTRPVFLKTLVRARHIKSFEVIPMPGVGWEVSERTDQQVTQKLQYTDWHRVERTLTRFVREISQLHNEGWIEA
jgi:hypothetical protein